MVKQLSSWVPENMMAAAKDINAMSNEFGGGITKRGTLLGMDSHYVDYCGFCGDGEVGGSTRRASAPGSIPARTSRRPRLREQ